MSRGGAPWPQKRRLRVNGVHLEFVTNLVLLCPYHHRLHHRGGVTIIGPADRLVITDTTGRALTSASVARPPTTPPPDVPPYPGPTGEHAD